MSGVCGSTKVVPWMRQSTYIECLLYSWIVPDNRRKLLMKRRERQSVASNACVLDEVSTNDEAHVNQRRKDLVRLEIMCMREVAGAGALPLVRQVLTSEEHNREVHDFDHRLL